jgi:isomerase DpgB
MVTGPQAMIRIDGTQPLSAALVAELAVVCNRAEDHSWQGTVLVHVSGAPGPDWASDLPIALVSKWERGLRRLECIPAITVAVADGDCGGSALDALLATDYRIASAATRLLLPTVAGASWPGMALYRLVRQSAGATPARRAVLLGAPIAAGAALAMGVIDEVAEDVTVALAKAGAAVAAAAGTDLALRRQLMMEALTTNFEEALGFHLAACDRALRRAVVGAA